MSGRRDLGYHLTQPHLIEEGIITFTDLNTAFQNYIFILQTEITLLLSVSGMYQFFLLCFSYP